MRHDRRHFMSCTAALAGSALPSLPQFARAQAPAWPAKPVTLIAPYPAGGGVDAVARLLGERLAQRFGQAFNIDNRPCAGATLGATALARSSPDGYTLMLGSIVDYAIAPHVHKGLPFEMQRDLLPVVELGFGTVALIVNAEVPAKTLKDLVALAKAKPGELSYASSGIGGLQHLNAEMFKQMAGVDMVHVPYKGTGALMPDLLAGRVPMMFENVAVMLPHLKKGALKPLAVSSGKRTALLPDLPTVAETGMGLEKFEVLGWFALLAPSKTPVDVMRFLNAELNKLITKSAIATRLQKLGAEPMSGSQEQAAAYIRDEQEKWGRVIREAGIKAQ